VNDATDGIVLDTSAMVDLLVAGRKAAQIRGRLDDATVRVPAPLQRNPTALLNGWQRVERAWVS
jgi:hypothetical protein